MLGLGIVMHPLTLHGQLAPIGRADGHVEPRGCLEGRKTDWSILVAGSGRGMTFCEAGCAWCILVLTCLSILLHVLGTAPYSTTYTVDWVTALYCMHRV